VNCHLWCLRHVSCVRCPLWLWQPRASVEARRRYLLPASQPKAHGGAQRDFGVKHAAGFAAEIKGVPTSYSSFVEQQKVDSLILGAVRCQSHFGALILGAVQ